MPELFITMIIAAVIVLAVSITIRRMKKGSSCCGDIPEKEKSLSAEKKKADYPLSVNLKISGMTCKNCAVKIENALNSHDEIMASVNFGSSAATVRMKYDIPASEICSIIARAGYLAEKQ